MIMISNVPLSVYNRALDLYGESPQETVAAARAALLSAESRKDVVTDWVGVSAFAQAVAEHLSSGDGYHLV